MATAKKRVSFADEGDAGGRDDDEDEGDEDKGAIETIEQQEILFGSSRFDEIGLSLADLMNEHTATDGLSPSDWKDCDADAVFATVGEGSASVFESFCHEFEFIRMAFQAEFDDERPSLSQVVSLFFGPDSKIFRVFKDNIKIDHKEFIKFMKTFCVQSAYRVSLTEMFNKNSYLDTTALCTPKEYKAIWKKIGSSCLPKDPKASVSTVDTLWMKLEDAVNELLREFLLEVMIGGQGDDGRKLEQLCMVLDDDKMHYNGVAHHHAFLQLSRHIRDNRTGFVCHHAVLSACSLLLAFKFDRKGDTAESSIKEMFLRRFVSSLGGTDRLVPDMSNFRLSADRAYSVKGLRERFFLLGGANFDGTIARNLGNPFTYDQKMKEGDERTCVPTGGGKTMFMKKATMKNGIEQYAFAYRNGYNGVTLSVSTTFDSFAWDFVLKNPADYAWHQQRQRREISTDEVLRRCFHPVGGAESVISEAMLRLLKQAPVQPLTMAQSSCQGWFFYRYASQTSRSVDNGFKVYIGNEEELDHPDAWTFVKNYVAKAGSRSYSQQEEEVEMVDAAEEEETARDEGMIAGGGEAQDVDEEDETAGDANGLEDDDDDFDDTIELEMILDDDEQYIADVVDQLEEGKYSHETVSYVLSELGATVSNDQDDVRALGKDSKKLLAWLAEHPLLRPVYFGSASKLKAFAKSLIPACILAADVTPTAARSALKVHLAENPMATIDMEHAAAVSKESTRSKNLTKKQQLMRNFIACGVLPKLATEQRSDIRRGLDLEEPMAKQLLRDSSDGKTRITVHEITSAPLCNRKGLEIHSVNCSLDYAAIVRVPGERTVELAGIECKGRVKPTTAAAQKKQMRDACRMIGVDCNEKYIIVDAMSDAFPYFVNVRKEALQILHHAFCYDFRYVLIIFCNTHGSIIGGVWVHFSVELKTNWGNVLRDMHTLGLAYAYRPPSQPVFQSREERDEVEQVVQTIVVAGGDLDMASFLQWLALWRLVRLTWLPPLPPIARILPCNLSNWNAVKGGSDTITKLLWTGMYAPPNKKPQSAAVSRMLLLCLVNIHRLNHLATAASDVKSNYKSLRHFRHAANERFSFYESLLAVSKCPAFASLEPRRLAGVNRSGQARQQEAVAPATTGRNITLAGVPITGATPKRKVMHRYQHLGEKDSLSTVALEVLECRVNCPGHLVTSGKQTRGTCAVCNTEARSYCLVCHTYCHDVKLFPGAKETTFDMIIPNADGNGKGKMVSVPNSCYWYLHRDGFTKAYGGK